MRVPRRISANCFPSVTGQRLHEVAIHAGEQAVRHLDEGDAAAQRGIDLPQLEPDIAAAHHQQPLRHVRHLERGGRVHDALARGHAGQRGRLGAGGHDGVAESDRLRRLALHPQRSRALEDASPAHHLHLLGARHGGEAPGELAHHALRLPLPQRVERHSRRAELHPELARALGFAR